ncbi:MAG: hypothetical protein H6715_03705 [Myxococcales bacterium]|nr:hypothetical protein [Myxococcales bacterium]MCB9709495.1 hypothetical protein [Myxococcales bacterium]
MDEARQSAGCGVLGYSPYACPDGYVCQADGACVVFDPHKHTAFRLKLGPSVETLESSETPARTDGSLNAYQQVATTYLRQRLVEQGDLLERLGMAVQKLDPSMLRRLAEGYAKQDARQQELDELATTVARMLDGFGDGPSLDDCEAVFDGYDFRSPISDSLERGKREGCLAGYEKVLSALEVANEQLTSFDAVVFARMRTSVRDIRTALRHGSGDASDSQVFRWMDLPSSLHAVTEEILLGLGQAQLLFPIVRLQVNVDLGSAVLGGRVGYFAQLVAQNLTERVPQGADVIAVFHRALYAAVGEMKANQDALTLKLQAAWPESDAWQLAPIMQHSGLLAQYPELNGVHLELENKLASMQNWQPILNGVAAGVCIFGAVLAIKSVIGAPAATLICAPATALGFETSRRLWQLSANAQMLAYFGPEQGLMPSVEADALAQKSRVAGIFVALDFLGLAIDGFSLVRSLGALQDSLQARRVARKALVVDLRDLPPLTAGGTRSKILDQMIAQSPDLRNLFNEAQAVPWSHPDTVSTLQYGFDFETTNFAALGRWYRSADIEEAIWAAMDSQARARELSRLVSIERPTPVLVRLSSAEPFLPSSIGRDGIHVFEINGIAPVDTLAEFRENVQWVATRFASTDNPSSFHLHVSFPSADDAGTQALLTRYWLLANETWMHRLYQNTDAPLRDFFEAASKEDYESLLRALSGAGGMEAKLHFVGFRVKTVYGPGRMGLELRVGGNVTGGITTDQQLVHLARTVEFLKDPTRPVRFKPTGLDHVLGELDPLSWDLPGQVAYSRLPDELREFFNLPSWRTASASVPMVDWHTRPFLAHKEADILAARKVYIEDLQAVRSRYGTMNSRDAYDEVVAALNRWAQALRLDQSY